ncbi:hypothetical protein [Streptomyces tendae]
MAAGADVSWVTMDTDALGLLPGISMFGKAGLVKIGGKGDFVHEVAHVSSGLKSRMGGLVSAGYHEGQWLGTKGINTFFKGNMDPFSGLGRTVDAGLKIALKVATHITSAVSGD